MRTRFNNKLRFWLCASFLVLITFTVHAHQQYITFVVTDAVSKKGIPGAHITATDTGSRPLFAQGYTDVNGCWKLLWPSANFILNIDSIPMRCDGTNETRKFYMESNRLSDTVRIVLSHFWVDRNIEDVYFDIPNGRFSYWRDSAATHSYVKPDSSTAQKIRTHGLLELYNLCGAFSRIEVRTYYTDAESALHGDSLAIVRAQQVINLFEQNGMKNIEFVITPVLYSQRPLKESDGTMNYNQIALLRFMILDW